MTQTAPQFDGTLTVDVEDYFHVSGFASQIRPEDWDHYDCRVVESTRTVLELLAKYGTQGTFFVLGWVAERFPALVTEIATAGHEIGCHSHMHQLVYDLGPRRFRQDLVKSRDVIQQITGQAVRLFRSPSFSVTRQSQWALPILADEGFEVDSSIYPIRHDRYGIPDAPLAPHVIETPSGSLTEFPGMVSEVGSMRIPAGGGGYLRLMPWHVTSRLLRRIRAAGRPLNVYVHPWEFDPDQPRIKAPLKSRFRHYQNLHTTHRKVQRMLGGFRLTCMSAALRDYGFTVSGETSHECHDETSQLPEPCR